MQSHWELGWEARLAGLGWGGRRLELEGADVEGGARAPDRGRHTLGVIGVQGPTHPGVGTMGAGRRQASGMRGLQLKNAGPARLGGGAGPGW